MIITFKDFHKLNFPLYVLPSDNWFLTDGVLFLNERVLDEKNMPGKTLGVRRIQCGRRDLLPLTKAVFTIPDLIQSKTKTFIDSLGEPFIYQKTYHSKLKCFRIKEIIGKETASLLKLEGYPAPFTIPRPPLGSPKYARMLHYNGAPWIVYDYVSTFQKDTYRRV